MSAPVAPHAPFQDGSKHAANQYCPTCHGQMDPYFWDADGRIRQDAQHIARVYRPGGAEGRERT